MPSKKGKSQPAGVGMTPSKTKLGSFIRARRLKLDLRQISLAKQAGVGQTLVSVIEVGTKKHLNNQQLERFAKALQCDPEELRKRMPVKHTAKPTTELGKLIRSRRKELGLTLADFAKRMGITLQRARRLEIRKSPRIRYGLIKLLASTLNLDLSAFAQFVGTTRKQTTSKLGQLVRTRRKELGMSIRELAKKLHVSYQFVSQIELGQCSLSKSDDMIKRLAQVLKLDVNKLKAVRPAKRQNQRETALGKFVTTRRLELRLTQAQVAQRAQTAHAVVSKLERGIYHLGSLMAERISKALDCGIPADLIPSPKPRGRPRIKTM